MPSSWNILTMRKGIIRIFDASERFVDSFELFHEHTLRGGVELFHGSDLSTAVRRAHVQILVRCAVIETEGMKLSCCPIHRPSVHR